MQESNASGTDESTTGRHVPALDGIRGLAILMVLAVHLLTRFHASDAPLVLRLVWQAIDSCWVGVDLFFALSGFLITGVLYDSLHTPRFFRNFYARRALRLFPVYYGCLIVLVVVVLARGYRFYAPGFGLLAFNLEAAFRQSLPLTNDPAIFVGHLWSLSVEEIFYLGWPAAVLLLGTRRRILVGALAAAAASLLLRTVLILGGSLNGGAAYAWAPTRLDGLLLGGALAMLLRSSHRGSVLRGSPWIFAAGCVFVGAIFLLNHGLHPQDRSVATVGFTLLALTGCGLIGTVLRAGSLAARLCGSGVLRLFGRYSYCIYVLHFALRASVQEPIFRALQIQFPAKGFAMFGSAACMVLLLLTIAALSYRFVEQPALRWKRYFATSGGTPKLRADVAAANRNLLPGA